MKKTVCIFFCIAFIISLCSCSGIQKLPDNLTKTQSGSDITVTATKKYQEFKDETGKVVYIVDMELPQLESKSNSYSAEIINASLISIFEEYCEAARSNIENASDFMASRSSDKPWCLKLRCDESDARENVTSFLFRMGFSMYGSDSVALSSYKSIVFGTKTGEIKNLLSFCVEEESVSREKLIAKIVEKAKREFYTDGSISDEQLELIASTFDPQNFWCKDGKILYYVDRGTIVSDESSYYVCELSPSDYSGILDLNT